VEDLVDGRSRASMVSQSFADFSFARFFRKDSTARSRLWEVLYYTGAITLSPDHVEGLAGTLALPGDG
jgi:hypothetical protein